MEFGAPEVPDGFNQYEIGGKKVYVHKRVKAVNSGLNFKIKKMLFVKQIVVEGIRTSGF